MQRNVTYIMENRRTLSSREVIFRNSFVCLPIKVKEPWMRGPGGCTRGCFRILQERANCTGPCQGSREVGVTVALSPLGLHTSKKMPRLTTLHPYFHSSVYEPYYKMRQVTNTQTNRYIQIGAERCYGDQTFTFQPLSLSALYSHHWPTHQQKKKI